MPSQRCYLIERRGMSRQLARLVPSKMTVSDTCRYKEREHVLELNQPDEDGVVVRVIHLGRQFDDDPLLVHEEASFTIQHTSSESGLDSATIEVPFDICEWIHPEYRDVDRERTVDLVRDFVDGSLDLERTLAFSSSEKARAEGLTPKMTPHSGV